MLNRLYALPSLLALPSVLLVLRTSLASLLAFIAGVAPWIIYSLSAFGSASNVGM